MLVTVYGAFVPSGFLTINDTVLNVSENVKKIEGILGWWMLEVDDGTIPPTITGIHKLKFPKFVLYRELK